MSDEIVTFLTRMKKCVNNHQRRFSNRTYNGLSYTQVLINDFNITVKEAWDVILTLHKGHFCVDEKPDYYGDNNTYVFKREVNSVMAYIKLKIEIRNDEQVVCISFHKDN